MVSHVRLWRPFTGAVVFERDRKMSEKCRKRGGRAGQCGAIRIDGAGTEGRALAETGRAPRELLRSRFEFSSEQ